FIQLVFTVWTALLSIELEKKTGQRGTNVKILGEEVDRIRTLGIIDLIKDVLDYFNLPYHEGMLLDKLRRMGCQIAPMAPPISASLKWVACSHSLRSARPSAHYHVSCVPYSSNHQSGTGGILTSKLSK
ncbi:MAG: hypothetical protein SVM80_09200, partial [Halobacteriota archaeon]|nr:hypothetical protein [Halobacteriota archaeon]